ncbi:unnamed protein product [Allacma fusca]|uniref:Uncharacterized protein n=1 Tax=Allacma fusca TaxID=39272 RepID=A0A8J2LPB1_9HEXA|nr:unnamed protein product [Allacma fusca]
MGEILRGGLFLGILWLICGGSLKIIAPTAADIPVYMDPSLENTDSGEYWRQGMAYAKRTGFWSPHPSDYNPMRRPSPVLRPSSKRNFEDLPYHPLAKGVSLIQRLGDGYEDYMEVSDGSELRTKKHIWPSNLLYRLGSGTNQAPNDPSRKPKYVPSEPTNRKKSF